MKLLKHIGGILLFSLVVYLLIEFLNEKTFFDFSKPKTIDRLIVSLIAAILNELVIKYRRKV